MRVNVFRLISFLLVFFFLGNHIKAEGKIYGTLIGISDYQNQTDLENDATSARAFHLYLTSRLGLNVPLENVSLIINENATLARSWSALAEIMKKIGEGDQWFI